MRRDPCFFMDEGFKVRMALRRFKHNAFVDGQSVRECDHSSNHGYHNAEVQIGDDDVAKMPKLHEGRAVHGDLWPHDDPRWPTHCACGYAFNDGDEWQFNPNALYVRRDTGELVTQQDAPAGAMRDGWWLKEGNHYHAGPEGVVLMVKLPDGVWWCVDGPSYNDGKVGPGWTRTGDLPNVTANPSILTTRYHGWLRNGVLEEC